MLHVFADGSFDASRRSGAWAFVAFEDELQVHSASGSGEGRSNNSFEVLAVLRAMSWIGSETSSRGVVLWTDSAHVVEGCKRWRSIWRNNRWKSINPNQHARRREIPDAPLWMQLDALLLRNPGVSISWCKGHSGVEGNELADALANSRR